MKKILTLLVFIFSLNINAQDLHLFESSDLSKNNKKASFKNQINKAENYFYKKETNKKGSGYKPFKRWEHKWKDYLLNDGTIAPVEHLWEAWKQKNKLTKSSKNSSNWLPIGPYDQSSKSGQGRVNAIAVDPNDPTTIYVGAPAGGLWKSTDDGLNWIPLTDDLPQIGVSGIAIDKNDSNVIYISTGDDDNGDSYSIGVLKSTDGGSNWKKTGNILGNPTSSNEIVIDPNNSNRIWVATSNGLFLSTNGGDKWTRKQAGHIRDFKLKPNNPNTIYAVSNNRFYKSTNGGDFFQVISNGLPNSGNIGRLRVEVTPNKTNNVYLLATEPPNKEWGFLGIYKSTNSGDNFTKTKESDDIFNSDQAWFDLAFTISPTDADEMYVGVLDIWKTTDEGDNFTKINDWRNQNMAYTHADIHFMRFFNGVLYAGTDGGIYRSNDGGNSFTDLTKNLAISQFYKIAVSRKNSSKMAGGLQDNGGFALNNTIWNNYFLGDGMDVASDPNNQNTFYGFTQFGSDLTVTKNSGASSTFITNSPVKGNWVTPLVATKGCDLYSGFDQIYMLKDNTWKKVSNHNFGGNIEALEIDPSNNNNIYVSKGLNLYISNDKGKSFSTRIPSQTGLFGVNISSIEVHNSNSNIIWVTTTGVDNIFGPSSGHNGGGVFVSNNGGLTFTNITGNLPNESKFVVRHHPYSKDNSIYVGTSLGVYYINSTNGTWEVFSNNLPNVAITDLEINPYDNTITAATYGRGVWQSSIPAVSFPDIDVDFIKTIAPDNNITCSNLSPKIKLYNNGKTDINSLTINYTVDGNIFSYNWSGTILPEEFEEIELPNKLLLNEGIYTLNTEVILNNDSNPYNNNFSADFVINRKGEEKFVYTFNNASLDKWITFNDLWQINQPTSTDLGTLNVTSAYVTNASGNYPDKTTAFLISPCFDLTGLVNPKLRFDMAFKIELNWDVLYMEYSTDYGTSWNILGTANDPNWYNSSYRNASRPLTKGKQWTGSDTTLKEYSYDLSSFTNEPSIMFRFIFASDEHTNEEGVVIDNFQIDAQQVLSTENLEKSNFLIYPNPSSNIFNIKNLNPSGEKMNLEVFDITGKLIKNVKNINSNEYQLDLENASKGIYFLRVNIDNKFLLKKLILQ